MALLTFDQLALATPDGHPLFSGLTLALGRERVGLVGRNGSGKSSLLRLVAQGETPVAGTIATQGRIAMLDQLPPDGAMPVADALGIGDAWAQVARIEAGQGRAADFETVDWSLPARVDSIVADLGLPADIMTRRIGSLSGGEHMRVALARLLLAAPDLILLDEPTNNLDAEGRAAIVTLLSGWKGGALVASHDRALLNHMDRIVELSPASVRIHSGGWDSFAAAREADRARKEEALEQAARAVKTARRDAQNAFEKQARHDRAGQSEARKGSAPKILLGAQKRRAEATAGRLDAAASAQIEAAEQQQRQAQAGVDILTPIRFAVPPTGLAANAMLVEARGVSLTVAGRTLFGPLDLIVRGPERIALTGANGSGKTSLLRLLLGTGAPTQGRITAAHHRMALLDQNLTLLDAPQGDDDSLLATMQRLNPGLNTQDAHAALAAAGFRGRWAARSAASLSGGERMRLALACLFARPDPPQMMLLDEPTNHLDMEATLLLETALADYDGALLCVSHDTTFRDAIGLKRVVHLGG